MTYTDQTLVCVSCGKEFTFSASEQEFFAQKGLSSPPKRCSACRKRKRRSQSDPTYAGEYRSPAFRDPAFHRPKGKKGRGTRPHRRGEYRSPAFRDEQRPRSRGADEYRSPAFRDADPNLYAEEYRSPAFREYDHIRPEEEYRSPAFREYDHLRPEEEYRSPAFPTQRADRRAERPLFKIVCVACGQEAMVPFVPEEKEDPMCKECYLEHRELLRKEALESRSQQDDTQPAETDQADFAAAAASGDTDDQP